MKKNTIFVAGGLALFVFVVSKIGGVPQMKAVWTGLPAILALTCLRLLMQTDSWATALRAEGAEASIGSLMGIRLSSQGAGYISVFGPLLSEPMKIKLLGGADTSAVATLADTGTYWLASSVFGILGCISAAVLVFLHGGRSAVALVILSAVFLAVLVLLAGKKALLCPLVQMLGERCPRWLRRGADLEAAIRGFASSHPAAIRRMFWLDIGCQLLIAAEVVAVLWILRIPFHAGTILALEAGNRGVKMLTGWLPARIGADEGAMAGLFAVLGLSSAAGLALALTRRGRDLLACGVGFAWLAWHTGFSSSEQSAQNGAHRALCASNADFREELACRP
jgi:hypothetical protein